VLLHEMIHLYLMQQGEHPKHDGKPWRDEISRLHKLITKKQLHVTGQRIIKVKDEEGIPRSKRVLDTRNVPSNVHDKLLGQGDIARWPHSCGIKFGAFGKRYAS
jgi:hypothetical protein